MPAVEVNFDGIIGPTHNYAGLSFGNLASAQNASMVSKPKAAALQGLAKMEKLMEMGFVQGLLLPHERPTISALKALGFTGSDRQIIADTAKSAPEILANCYSASAMWTANAATVSPSADSADGKLHITPANLNSMFHRSIEAELTGRMLQMIFPPGDHFEHHGPLPSGRQFSDEGAANHNRFCSGYGERGFQLFVFGRYSFRTGPAPWKFPARQTYEASRAVARLHRLNPKRTMFVQQHPIAIDGGAFHNDVVGVANRNVFFYHAQAFEDPRALEDELRERAPDIDFHFIEVPKVEVGLDDAIKSYMFNSQLLTLPGDEAGNMIMVMPEEAQETESARLFLEGLKGGNHPIKEILFFDVRQSMRNGGGPACLRLRVVLEEAERAAVKTEAILTPALAKKLKAWINKHYRDRLAPADLADPALMDESRAALDELTQILDFGAFYDFQR